MTDKIYPDSLSGNIFSDGGVYATALIDIRKEIGREETDRLVLQSLYGLATNMNMRQAASLLFEADSMLNQGAYFCAIYYALLQRGLTDMDTTVNDMICYKDCNGDWFGTAFLDSCGSCVAGNTGLVPCAPTGSNQHMLEHPSLHIYPNPTKEILNVKYFIPENDVIELSLFDIYGRKLLTKSVANYKGEHLMTLNLATFAPGLYICIFKSGSMNRMVKVQKH